MSGLSANDELASRLVDGDRRSLARAITLIESTRSEDRASARKLLDSLEPPSPSSIRLGVTGAPGAGKSTLIEALGLEAIDDGRRVAVLAVDPSSAVSGGSILGDKTRMVALGRHTSAFVRPSPSSGSLGGVARRTRDAVRLCEAAGYDLVIVETVGVGQSEIRVSSLVDHFLLVVAPAGGDELQGIKRGIMELADLIVVNKADGDLEAAANRAASDLRMAVQLLRPKHPGTTVDVLLTDALTGRGIEELWRSIRDRHSRLEDTVATARAEQDVAWMWQEVTDDLLDRLQADPAVRGELPTLQQAVRAGDVEPSVAARRIVELLFEADG